MDGWQLYHGPLHDREFPCMTAFFDESGHSASTRVVAMGGAMAGPKQWAEVSQGWRETLDKFSITVFHMSDFENRQGQFRGWDEIRKRSLLTELMRTFDAGLWYFMGSAVVVQDFNRIPHNRNPLFRDPWYFCYQSCFEAALSPSFFFDPKAAGVEDQDANIRACFFEEHRQFKWGPLLFALAGEHDRKRGVKRPTGIIGWGGKASSVHFQLADLVAYELRKHVENAIFSGGRPTRWPMRQLLKRVFVANVFDDSKTPIPMEVGGFALFRSASLADIDESGRVLFNAPTPHWARESRK
jgi:hypothetical protein